MEDDHTDLHSDDFWTRATESHDDDPCSMERHLGRVSRSEDVEGEVEPAAAEHGEETQGEERHYASAAAYAASAASVASSQASTGTYYEEDEEIVGIVAHGASASAASSSGSVAEKEPSKQKKLGRPPGKAKVPQPAKTVAGSTNAENRQKIKNLFRKAAVVDLCTDIVNPTPEQPSTKFVLVQVSTAPTPKVDGGGPHKKVKPEKVKTVTAYGGPTEDDLRSTLYHAGQALAGTNPAEYNLKMMHNTDDVEDHFRQIEEARKLPPQHPNKQGKEKRYKTEK